MFGYVFYTICRVNLVKIQAIKCPCLRITIPILLLPLLLFPHVVLKGCVNINGTIYSRKPEIYAKYLAHIKRVKCYITALL